MRELTHQLDVALQTGYNEETDEGTNCSVFTVLYEYITWSTHGRKNKD
jgi:hypothetical protein